MAMALLLSLTSGVVYSAQAEPFVAVQSKRELAARPFATFVAEAAQRSGLPTLWINAVMMAESAGDAQAVSPQGAMGLMQIMPDTWDNLRSPMVLASIRSTRATISSLAPRTCGRCTIATGRPGFWLPTMQAPSAAKNS
jgi:hypothetical protein